MAAAAAILNYFSTFWQLFGDRRKIAKSTFFQHFGDSPGDPSEGLFRNFSVTFGRFVGIGPVAGEAHHKAEAYLAGAAPGQGCRFVFGVQGPGAAPA